MISKVYWFYVVPIYKEPCFLKCVVCFTSLPVLILVDYIYRWMVMVHVWFIHCHIHWYKIFCSIYIMGEYYFPVAIDTGEYITILIRLMLLLRRIQTDDHRQMDSPLLRLISFGRWNSFCCLAAL